jgi:hypothetical protein
MSREKELLRTMNRLLDARPPGASICPSEVVRAVDPDGWRALMPAIRQVAARAANTGQIIITQGERTVDPSAVMRGSVRGPIRLRRAPRADV